MAYNTENILDDRRETNMTSCQYRTTDPYSLYAASTRVYPSGAYIDKLSGYTQGSMLQQGQTNHLFSSYACYPQNFFLANRCRGDDMVSFPSLSMADDVGRSQFYGTGSSTPPSLPVNQMTSDYTGLLDASDPVKHSKTMHPFYWRKRGNSVPAEGMTRTKDKYRVVYTEKQRIGLEKEFKANKFITMKKKTELSKELDLSERQIKIWFQNRRAKERRQRRKAETEADQVTSDELADDSLESPISFDNATVFDDKLNETDLSSSAFTYPVLNTLEQSQCRFQQIGSCDNSAKSTLYQSEIERRFSTSPKERNLNGASLTKCNVSPFTANPDWNLIYRT